MRKHMSKGAKRLLTLYVSVGSGITIVVIGWYVLAVLLGLPKKANTVAYSYQYDHYTYSIRQRPGVIISGKPVTFAVHVEDAAGPVKNHEFTAAITHADAIFAAYRPDEVTEKKVSTNEQGDFTFTYQSKFFDLRADNAFGFIVLPIRSPEEQRRFDEETRSIHPSKLGIQVHELTIYPKWLGWLTK